MDLDDWLASCVGDRRPGAGPSAGGSPAGAPPEVSGEVDDVAHRLDEVAGDLNASRDLRERLMAEGTGLPLSMGNALVQSLNACEGLAVGGAGVAVDDSWAMFRGRALDAFVAHVLFAGPVADPIEDLRSMWRASERHTEVDSLDHWSERPGAAAELAQLALSAGFFGPARSWVPRTEVRMGVDLQRAISLRGRVDVLLGGPGTGLPAVLVEVKSSELRDAHFAQLRHYLMLAALRHGAMPAAAALWSPQSGLVPIHITGSARSAAERVAVAVGRLTGLWAGREASLTPGVHCRFCEVQHTCRRAHDLDDPWEVTQ